MANEIERMKNAYHILTEASAGLDLDHQEYYGHQAFAVIPVKYLKKVLGILKAEAERG